MKVIPKQECKSCGVSFPLSSYQKAPNNKHGYNYRCSSCLYEASKPRLLKFKNSPAYWTINLRNKALQRAKDKNLEFTLTKDFILNKVLNGVCEVTGVALDFSGGARKPYTPSLDRIIPDQGYTPENVRLVCWIYNSAKGTFTDEDVLNFVKLFSKEN
jgi:hypothetical protein